jgi:hypothetical protein
MARRKKGAVRRGHGVMCNLCGINCGKGGALKVHIEGTHGIDYSEYKRSFYPKESRVIADSWDSLVSDSTGNNIVIHVLVRRFESDPGPRGVPRAARVPQQPTSARNA